MSSVVLVNRPSSPSTESSSSVSTSFTSTSSGSSAHSLIYSRDELLGLATSPLSQTAVPSAVTSFPEIMRKTRRGVMEAYQALEYARSTSGGSPPSTPAPTRDRSPKRNATQLHTSTPPRAIQTHPHAQVPPPVWKVDVYVPPGRRVEPEQRVRPGRDTRSSRAWRRPAQARAVQVQGRW